MSGPADEHRRVAGAFTTTVEGVTPEAWDQPAPVDGWVARDVVRHLVEWFPAFLQGSAGIALPAGPSVDDDPAGAWRTQTEAVQALLDDPDRPVQHRGHRPDVHRWHGVGVDRLLDARARHRQVPLALLAGIIGGGLWGGIVGVLEGAHRRARSDHHDHDQLHRCAAHAVVVEDRCVPAARQGQPDLEDGGEKRLPHLFAFLDNPTLRAHTGFLVALLGALFMWWLFGKSRVGFEMRSFGANPDSGALRRHEAGVAHRAGDVHRRRAGGARGRHADHRHPGLRHRELRR